MIRLFGRSNSIAVQKVMWTAAELNLLNVERIDAGGKFGLPDNYLSVNPNGKVPTIIDSNGFSLWESHAICKYLIRKYADNSTKRLYPFDDIQRTARIDQWMDWKATVLYPPIQKLFMTMIRTAPADRNWAAYEAAVTECDSKWTIVDKELGNKMLYICGDELSLADIPLAICYHRWLLTADDKKRSKFPAIDDWFGRLKEESKPFKEIVIDLPLT
eukprot:gene34300-44303_t